MDRGENYIMKSKKVNIGMDKITDILKGYDFVHSILLFGSMARGKQGRDIDVCIIPSRDMSMRERLSLGTDLPPGVDISVFFELPVHIRKRIFEEGDVLYTRDMYHLLTLGKENDLEYSGYRKYREYYNRAVKDRAKKRLGVGHGY